MKKRLFKVARKLNVTADRIVDFLRKSGLDDALSGKGLNAQIRDEEAYRAIINRFENQSRAADKKKYAELSPDSQLYTLFRNLTQLNHHMSEAKLQDQLRDLLQSDSSETDQVDHVVQKIVSLVKSQEEKHRKAQLETLYDHEKRYLELIKEHKEEIKFIHTFQEDVRRERAHFFSQVLKEVSATLEQAQVDEQVASEWIEELVRSYTASLDVSKSLTTSRAIEMAGKLKQESDDQISSVQEEAFPQANGNA